MWDHLLGSRVERVAFAFADYRSSEESLKFQAKEIYLVQPDEVVFESDFHITLTDDCLAKVIKMASDKGAALVEFHSHLSPLFPAKFSPNDISGFREFVPHIWWRLKQKPILAIVVSPTDFDALVWHSGPDSPEALAALVVEGDRKLPTGDTINDLEREYERG